MADRPAAQPGQLAVGRVGPVHGMRGDVYVEPWTDDPDLRFAPGSVLFRDGEPPLVVAESRVQGGRQLVRFEGYPDRDAAASLRGTVLAIDAVERPVLDDPDEFYDSDLTGLAAEAPDGTPIGPVREVLHIAGAHYLAVEVGGRPRLVPFVAAIVPTVDIRGGRVVVDAPEGLFDL